MLPLAPTRGALGKTERRGGGKGREGQAGQARGRLNKASSNHRDKRAKVEAKGNLGPAAKCEVPAVLPKSKEDVDPAQDDGKPANAPMHPSKERVPQDLALQQGLSAHSEIFVRPVSDLCQKPLRKAKDCPG